MLLCYDGTWYHIRFTQTMLCEEMRKIKLLDILIDYFIYKYNKDYIHRNCLELLYISSHI